MRTAFSIYSGILKLRGETYEWLRVSDSAVPFAILLFFTVSLLAGCGKWLMLPGELNRPLLTETVDTVGQTADRVFDAVIPRVDEGLRAISHENLSFALGEVLPPDASVTPQALAEVMARAGLTSQQLLELVAEQTTIPAEARQALAARPPSPQLIDDLLAETGLTAAEMKDLLVTQAVAARADELLGGIPISTAQLQNLFVQLALTPERIRAITVQLGVPDERVNEWIAEVDALPERTDDSLQAVRDELETLEPPLGTRPSRAIRLFGNWLATPFELLSSYLPLALVALLVAKALGGRATLPQHLVASALAVAPAWLLILTIPADLSRTFPITVAAGLSIFGRMLGLVAIVWAAAILLKALSVNHRFSVWRAAATVVLTYVVVYVLLPMTGLFAFGYLLRG